MRLCDLRIEDIAFGGKGVAREQGKAVFVPYTIEGELVSAEIVREKKQFAEAELVEVKERSPNRVAPVCPYFGRCGGCAYQHIDYQHQLAIKWRQVRDALYVGRERESWGILRAGNKESTSGPRSRGFEEQRVEPRRACRNWATRSRTRGGYTCPRRFLLGVVSRSPSHRST